MKLILISLFCIYGAYASGKYAKIKITEGSTTFTQESIFDESNKLLINLVPGHNGRVAAKFVFDAESDLMMSVYEYNQECTVQKSFLPTGVYDAYDKIQAQDNQLVTDQVEEVTHHHVEVLKGFEMSNEQLPEKFRDHCPPGYRAYSAHLVDTDKSTEDDPYVANSNVTHFDEAFDYVPEEFQSEHQRKKRSTCYALTDNGGFSIRDCFFVHEGCTRCKSHHYEFTCTPSSGSDNACTYILVNCKRNGAYTSMNCLAHITSGDQKCRSCCMNSGCPNVPLCGSK